MVPVTSPAQTIGDCIEAFVSPEFIDQAIREARHRGLLSREEVKALRNQHRRAMRSGLG